MLGWTIFKHAFSMLQRNLMPALQIFLVPYIIAFAAVYGLFWVVIGSDRIWGESTTLMVALSVLIMGFVGIWTVVSWHRFVLLEEYPTGWVPRINRGAMIAYFGRLLVLLLIVIVFALPAIFVTILAGESAGPGVALFFLYMLVVAVVLFRYSIMLPGAAAGHVMSTSATWAATTGSTGPLIVIMLCFFVLNKLTQWIGMMFAQVPMLYMVWNLPTQAFISVLWISVLTTLYGYYVEKRDLA